MTRRIVITIVVNVWLVLIAAGCSTYYISRSLLIADLDETIVSRVASMSSVERPGELPMASVALDRYMMIDDKDGKTINPIMVSASLAAASSQPAVAPKPQVGEWSFNRLADGKLQRTLKITNLWHVPDENHPKRYPITVVYSASADHIETYLNHLLFTLSGFALLAAFATAISAYSVARAALKPMRAAAEVIGTIDERSLNRRIEVEKLPSELVPVGRRLNDMLGRLETAFTHRRQFLADASHELRTPVAAIVTTLEVALRRRRESHDYVETLDRCLNDARVLHQLVVALLEQARAERFGHQPELGPVAVATVLRECVRVVEPLARARGLEIICELPDNLMVLADEQIIRSAVGNLLSNAIEYTPGVSPGDTNGRGKRPGRIRIAAGTQKLPRGIAELPTVIREAIPEGVAGTPCRFRIGVADNGPGVAAEHLAGIFEPFYRADAARAHPENHLGLGLALVRTQVRSLGGECRVDSPPPGDETGCLFTLEMPTLEISASTAKVVSRPVREPVISTGA